MIEITEKNIENFWKKVKKTNSCWIWTGGVSSRGYGNFCFHRNGKFINNRAHRFSYFLSKGEIPKKMLICHKCNNPLCVKPAHLYAGTTSDNVRDAIRDGLWNPSQGEKNGQSKLTKEKVLKIRELHKNGNYTQQELANLFGVIQQTISLILSRKHWAHI